MTPLIAIRDSHPRRDAQKGEEYRSPPNNLEAEQALLGALLVNNDALHNEFLPRWQRLTLRPPPQNQTRCE